MPRGRVTTTSLKKKADSVFAKYIRLRDSKDTEDGRVGICITCRNPVAADGVRGHAGHFMSRRFSATRYDEQNVSLQCSRCNVWGSGEQYEYSLALDERYGAGTAAGLREKANQYHKFTTSELQEIINKYQLLLEEM